MTHLASVEENQGLDNKEQKNWITNGNHSSFIFMYLYIFRNIVGTPLRRARSRYLHFIIRKDRVLPYM